MDFYSLIAMSCDGMFARETSGMDVARPLRKTKLDGTPYYRREAVEAEIQELATLSVNELERRSVLWPSTTPGFVSPEALVYFVRNLPDGAPRDKLTEQLLSRP